MTRIASLAVHKLTLAQTLETQRRLIETQIQISSGKVSSAYTGIAQDSRRLVNLEKAVSEADGYLKNIQIVDLRLQTMETSVAGAFEVASRLRDLLVNGLNLDNASLLALDQRAESMLQELAGLLNVELDGRHLFAGARTDTAPIDLSILLNSNPPLVDAAEFTGAATASGTGITGLAGVAGVQVETGNTGDAFQLTYDDVGQILTLTNLNGGASAQLPLGGVPPAGQTKTYDFTVGGERVIVTLDETFNSAAAITTDSVTGAVGAGLGAFGTITVTGTGGVVSGIDQNTIETSGAAASATLTLSSSDGNFVATGIDLSAVATVPVTLTNATTGATISLQIGVTTGLDDAAIADPGTEVQLNDFLENVAATNGAVNLTQARPGDPGYDPANPSFYKGDSAKLITRIERTSTVDYGIPGNQPGFEKLFRALFMVRNANPTPGSVDQATLEAALGLAIEAIDEIPDLRSSIGSDRLALEQAVARHQDFKIFAGGAIGEIENVDVVAAISRISAEQTQLEASYLLTARLSRLSLVNFLR